MTSQIFASSYRAYQQSGFEPRPVAPGTKSPKVKGWNKPDLDLPNNFYEICTRKYPDQGLCLRLGTILPDGTMLAALDIDDERYVNAASYLLGNPPCGRIGSRGIAWFVRIKGELGKSKISYDIPLPQGGTVHVGELLGEGCCLVIPPTIQPDTGAPYQWVGTPLLSVGLDQLPVIEV